MQRKRQRDYYSSGTVELGSSLMSVTPMRKLTMKRAFKWMVFVIILYVVYSIYRKTQMVSSHVDDYDAVYGNAINIPEHKKDERGDTEEIVDKRVKQQINKVFEDLKRKQDIKEKQEEEKDVFQDYRDNIEEDDKANDGDELNINVQLKQNVEPDDDFEQNANDGDFEQNANDADGFDEDNKIFGADDDGENDNIENNVDEDDFEPVDEKEEKKDIELEKQIEELLADAFKEAEEEVKVEVPKVDEQIIGVNKNEPVVNGNTNEINAGNDNELRVERLKAELNFKHQREFEIAVKQMGHKLHPSEIRNLNAKIMNKAQQTDDDHELPPFVTAVRQTTIEQVTQLIASIQQHLPGRKVYVYDLDLTKDQKKQFMSYCGVRVRLFMASVFPKYVRNLDNLHWKALIMQTALSEFGHITWINPLFRLGTHEVAPLVHESHERGILVVGQKASYSTFSATHPDMLKFIPTDKKKLTNSPHIEIRAIMVHNTPEVHENIMKVFTACALEETCMAPEGAKWKCRFDFTGRSYADCHRYDESALNILLKNWFNYDMNLFARGNNYFRAYDPTYRPKLKKCRDPKDIRDTEL